MNLRPISAAVRPDSSPDYDHSKTSLWANYGNITGQILLIGGKTFPANFASRAFTS